MPSTVATWSEKELIGKEKERYIERYDIFSLIQIIYNLRYAVFTSLLASGFALCESRTNDHYQILFINLIILHYERFHFISRRI